MPEDKHILSGIGDEVEVKAKISASYAYPKQVLYHAESPQLILFLRNRNAEFHKEIQRKLNELGYYDEEKMPKLLANSANKIYSKKIKKP